MSVCLSECAPACEDTVTKLPHRIILSTTTAVHNSIILLTPRPSPLPFNPCLVSGSLNGVGPPYSSELSWGGDGDVYVYGDDIGGSGDDDHDENDGGDSDDNVGVVVVMLF